MSKIIIKILYYINWNVQSQLHSTWLSHFVLLSVLLFLNKQMEISNLALKITLIQKKEPTENSVS